MIESVMVDELRAHLAEEVARGQFKTPPPGATDHVARILDQAARPVRSLGKRAGLDPERARRIASDLATYDASLVRGEAP